MKKAYDKAWLDAILYALHKNGVKGKNLQITKKMNLNLKAKVITKYGLTRTINIKDSIRQGGVLSVIEYATLIDEIAKELHSSKVESPIEDDEILGCLLWMDDVALIQHNLESLQAMMNITNDVALRYHVEFGAEKCKVIKYGKGPKSNIVLNWTTLEEVPAYKYLGDRRNNKGNLTDHIKEIKKKAHAATQKIITTATNDEFKGMQMRAIWELVNTTIIPIITYGSESWRPTKKEVDQVQKIYNESIKTILKLPQGTPTTILLGETGSIPIRHIIKKKKIMQQQRINKKGRETLIRRITEDKTSIWHNGMEQIKKEYNITDQDIDGTKNQLKTKVADAICKKIEQEVAEESNKKAKVKQWLERKTEVKWGKRPEYMDKLTRNQCKAIIKTRSRMLPTKENHKKTTVDEGDMMCRMCGQTRETQEHILQRCTKVKRQHNIRYQAVFEDDNHGELARIADEINRIMEQLTNGQHA